MTALVYTLIGVLVVWHLYGAAIASWHIAASELFDPWQKNTQYVIAWCLPIIGVAIILHILGPVVRKRRPGWIPLLEPIILSSFLLSVSHEAVSSNAGGDSSARDTNLETTSIDGD